jgi:hypothetical protein
VTDEDPWGFGLSTDSGRLSNGDRGWGGDPFEFGADTTSYSVPPSPPKLWLILSAATSVTGGVIAGILGERIAPAAAGWLLAGPIALTLLATFVWRDTVRRTRATRITYSWVRPAYFGCAALAILATFVSAARIGVWAGRYWQTL